MFIKNQEQSNNQSRLRVVSRPSLALFRVSSRREDGFIALTSVIIISAFIIILFIGMFFSAVEQIERVDSREFSLLALGLANSCAEEALNKLKNDLDYYVGETVNIGAYPCDILELDRTDTTRVIKARASVNGYTKRVQIEVNIYEYPLLEIMDWRMVSDFSDV